MRTVCLLGASGSIGGQSIEIMHKYRDNFKLLSFSVGKRTRCIRSILLKFPEVENVYVSKNAKKKYYQEKYPNVHFYSEKDTDLSGFINKSNVEMVINALVGRVGLKPTITALENNKIVALANKESLVIGGEVVNSLLSQGKGKLVPIDSEHVGLAKCLNIDKENAKTFFITASGGSLRDFPKEKIKEATIQDVLNHPNWVMGKKITVDSATMMNKVFEIIEAYYLFGIKGDNFKVFINRTSQIHAGIIYEDGYRIDYCKPDMRVPIKWALFEGNIDYKTVFVKSLDVLNEQLLDLDFEKYPLLKYAGNTLKNVGTYGAALNACNEIAVNSFLKGDIKYYQIAEVIDNCMNSFKNKKNPSLEDIFKADKKMVKKAKLECLRLGGKR